ncbi:hypothetical protein ACNKHT_20020 [Shigella flexneri]
MRNQVYMAGGGCTLPGRSNSVNAVRRLRRRSEIRLRNIFTLAGNACRPVWWAWASYLGGNRRRALAKSDLRPIGSRHPNPKAAELELRLKKD